MVKTLRKFSSLKPIDLFQGTWREGSMAKVLQYINHDPVMNLTKFMAWSTWAAYAFEWGKLLKCHLKGKTSRQLANGQNIDYSEKRKCPKGFIFPCTGVEYHNIQTCLLVYADLR